MLSTSIERKKQLNILIVEDNKVSAKILEKMLLSSQYPFLTEKADTLSIALQNLQNNNIDLVLLDLNLPDSNGLETIQKVYQAFENIPIIAITGEYAQNLGLDAISIGAQDYLIKGEYNIHLLAKSIYSAIEKKKFEISLNQKTKELENFVHTVSHELKNPLAIIQGFSSVCDIYATDEKHKHYLNRINSSVEFMTDLIHSLLNLAKIGKNSLKIEQVDINLMLCEISEIFSHNAIFISKNIKLVLEPNMPKIFGDRALIRQVFTNLISNAGKYMGDNEAPIVTVGCSASNDEFTEFFVEDNGIGISKENQDRIFHVFQRIKEVEVEGTGVGLSIVKKIVEYHKGSLRLTSTEGVGTKFFFSIPNKI